ncbi:hypothetical protein F511_10996 [Dorcoceras hygrometricum]|uniref:Uncharacterized protein n=1 Tax=Dorcoceras hygrometricum TaxID=472368 RepID=A0A2Z7CRQ0_9LAMI|nr:hypothetical protein F511_10996 [Dorcoceras hygrometricum]
MAQSQSFEQEIRGMISSLESHLSKIQHTNKKGGESSTEKKEEIENGVGIITLTGSNVGATMRRGSDGVEENPVPQDGEGEELTAFVNGNFQAINNSIMLDGSYSTNDPGVHLKIIDYDETYKSRKKKENGSLSSEQTA